jgi:carboxypeptidase C (cathepsin A)
MTYPREFSSFGVFREMQTVKSSTSLLLAFLCVLGAGPGRADAQMTTAHVMHAGEKSLAYTAEVGLVPLTDEATSAVHAHMFFTAYLVKSSDAARPIAFVWNGGPGAPSNWVHFRGFGPRLLEGSTFVDNADTPLWAADLVFVDPVGTSFSRPERAEYAKEYFSTVGDARATTQFIRTWLKLHHGEGRPVFLIGESFGGFRAGGATERLESQGQHVAGVVLISGGVASGPLIPKDVRTALVTPQRAAAALALGKAPADLGTNRVAVVRAATQWSLQNYLPALVNADKLTDAEREAIIKDLSRFTGFPASKIDRKTLVIGREYLKEMSPDPGKSLTTYDMRTTETPPFDESVIGQYFHDLGYRSERPYMETGPAADLLSVKGKPWVNDYRWPESEKWGPSYAEPWLPKAMEINPNIRVFVAAGLYDALNSCAENDVLLGMLEPDLARSYTMRCYPGGHMMYRDPDTRVTLSKDIRNFIISTVREK